jgi:hypothetical protein
MPVSKKHLRRRSSLPRSRKAEDTNPLSARFNTAEFKAGDEPETRDLSITPEDIGTEVLQVSDKDRPTPEKEPLTGWLVIIEGPGRGSSFPLVRGVNILGQGIDQQVSLDFGDAKIASENHARLIFDEATQMFLLEHHMGDIWISNQKLAGPRELNTGDQFQIGETVLHFVALCGQSFDW